jgi:hypothetical protein
MQHAPLRAASIVMLAGLSLAVPGTWAQAPLPLTVGEQVRLRAPPLVPDTARGVVVGVDGATLRLRRLGAEQVLAVPVDAVTLLQVRRTGSHPIRGLVTGLAVGATIGAVSASVGPGCAACPEGDGDLVVERTIRLGLVGGVVGLLVGAFSTTETWHEVALHAVPPAEPPPP